MKKALIFLIVLVFIGLFISGCKNSEVKELEKQVAELSEKLAEEGTEAAREEELPDSVPWQDAEYYIGETITVYGPVVDTKHFGAEGEGTTFLYIGKVYPDPKSLTIWIDDLDKEKFSEDPKTYYYGKSVTVTGLILENNGIPYIEVTDPSQINSGEGSVEKAPEEEIALIPWIEAKNHIGETLTVYGPVITTSYDEKTGQGITFINIGKNYPDPEGFSVWIDIVNRTKFSQEPEIYYSGKSISVTGLIVEIDGIAHMEVVDPDQIIIIEASGGIAETEQEEETSEEVIGETVEEDEVVEAKLTAPTIRFEIIEGPAFSQLGDNTCYYRVRAYTTGSPSPTVSFNKDDSNGSLGKDIAQINLHNKGESFTLEATATNSEGTASASITLTHTCQDHIPIIIQNNTGGNVSINLSGPGNYNFNIAMGQQIIYVMPGTYNYKGIGCGGSTLSGTQDLSSSNYEWKWWCE